MNKHREKGTYMHACMCRCIHMSIFCFVYMYIHIHIYRREQTEEEASRQTRQREESLRSQLLESENQNRTVKIDCDSLRAELEAVTNERNRYIQSECLAQEKLAQSGE